MSAEEIRSQVLFAKKKPDGPASAALVQELKTPPPILQVFANLQERAYPFFLDSAARGPRLGRYSFLGAEPFLVLTAREKEIEIIEGGKRRVIIGNPFSELRRLFALYRVDAKDAPVPFLAGAVGYFAYDLKDFIERLPQTAVKDLSLPDLYLAFYDSVIVYDHIENKAYISAVDFNAEDARGAQAHACARLLRLKAFLENLPAKEPAQAEEFQSFPLPSNFTQKDYLAAVRRAKEYIAAGDIYQVNLSQRFHTRISCSPYELYLRLRAINPAPFAAYFRFDDFAVLSSSPERFLKVTGSHIETRPIKGTRPRGRTPQEDERLKKELYQSEKDNAELAMIVDLERNDLGRVCDYGSVKVTEPKVLETFPTVHHLVATVEGEMHPRYDLVDLLKATFPGGSITGAPKIRAMEIIDELEPTRRSVYTGAIGYMDFGGNMDLNIVIRTILVHRQEAYFQVGGGIVADSLPQAEYDETMDKARALIASLRQVPVVIERCGRGQEK